MTSKSAQKQVRVSSRRQMRNKSARSALKTSITKAEKLLFTGETDEAKKVVEEAITLLDKAANKGIIHSNNAARRKARLMKKLNQVSTLPPVEAEPEPEPETEPEVEAKPAPKTRAKKVKE